MFKAIRELTAIIAISAMVIVPTCVVLNAAFPTSAQQGNLMNQVK